MSRACPSLIFGVFYLLNAWGILCVAAYEAHQMHFIESLFKGTATPPRIGGHCASRAWFLVIICLTSVLHVYNYSLTLSLPFALG
jgi:hypothetical protein